MNENTEFNNESMKEAEIPKKSKKKKVLIIIGFLLLLLLILTYFLLNHRLFNIRYIDYSNQGFVQKETVLAALGPEETHSNIFLFDLDQAEARLLEIDNINSVKINKIYPDKIKVEVDEEFEIGHTIKLGQKKYINQDGKIINGKASGNNGGFDYEISTESDSLSQEEISFIRQIMEYDFGDHVDEINFAKDGTIDIIYKDMTIYFETLENAQEDIANLEKIIYNMEQEDIDASAIYMNKNKQPIIVRENKGN